ncbi:hypothetical protein B0T10DRAFT_541128 [Thelonectria olida]|uniref:Uncharacterized protein n=1 Tax=Thelonectria olida TaxID=1576542 RepID=A0A9P9AG00_9HYPO|nr:hypothetical protein B0T10DRAFT_541128 [Thelonectria olida]
MHEHFQAWTALAVVLRTRVALTATSAFRLFMLATRHHVHHVVGSFPQTHAPGASRRPFGTTAHRPVWLSKTALVAFTVLFTCCAVALIALNQVIAARNGIPLTVSSSEYSWTYGPTAVLVLILALWRRVDYYFKSIQPWRELLAGPAPLDRSLLLDYITPFQGTSMIRAFRQGHYPVAATILSFFVLKLIILVSTTLFVVGPTSHTAIFPVQYKNALNATTYWHSGYSNNSDGTEKSPALDYLAKLNNASTDDADWKPQQYLAMQRFVTTAETPSATSIQAPVDVLVPKVTCENATLGLHWYNVTRFDGYYYTWDSATCHFNSSTGYVDSLLVMCTDFPCKSETTNLYGRSFPWGRANCSSGVEGELEIRYPFALTHLHVGINDAYKPIIDNSTAAICKIDYGVASMNATHDLSTGQVTLPDGALDARTKPLSNFTSLDLSEMIMLSIEAASETLKYKTDDSLYTKGMGPLFQLIVAKMGDPVDQDILLQPGIFAQALTGVFEGLVTTAAQEALLVNASSTSYAEGSIIETRLLTRPAALWTMPGPEGMSEKKNPWMPSVARRPMIALTIILPILMIGLLELLNQLSKSRNGLIYVGDTDSTVVSYVVRVTLTLAIFGIAAMFDNLDFTITAFAPWSSLRSGSAEANRSVLFNLLSVSPFLVLPQSIRRRQLGSAASNLSTLIASTMTIVVSGLWILTGPATVERPSTASLGSWDQAWLNNSKDDGGAAVKLNTIHHKSASTPTEIWNSIVLPTISLPSSNSSANYTYNVRGLRPVLNCTVVPQEKIKKRQNGYFVIPSANVTVPAACVKNASGEFGTLTFEYKAGEYYESEMNLTALSCSQGIEEVPVTVTYEGNGASAEVSTTQRPRLASGKAWSWRNGTAGAETMGFKIIDFLDNNLVRFVQKVPDLPNLDLFFDHLINGPYACNRTTLLGPQNADKLISAVTLGYTDYMAQVIHLNFRGSSNSKKSNLVSAVANVSSFSSASTDRITLEITGTRSQEITRLGIHETSKLILQVQLAIVTVLGLAGYLLVGMRDTLPRNPCTIASTMSFLAGSRLCDPKAGVLPRDAEFMNEKQLDRALGRWRFSLGWWKVRGDVTEEWEAMNTPVRETHSTPTISTVGGDDYRFGVDVGRPSIRTYSGLRHD